MKRVVELDVLCDMASAIVEREWDKTHEEPHTIEESNGDVHYIDEVQDEFNQVLDILDDICNNNRGE